MSAMSSRAAAKVIGILVAASLACNLSGQAAPTPPPVGTSNPTPAANAGDATATVSAATATSAAVSAATATGPAPLATLAASGDLTVEVLSAGALRLSWPALDGATEYRLEARYGAGEFFPIGVVPAERTSFEHYVLPASVDLAYRVTAADGTEIGVTPVSLPPLVPDPVTVQPMPFQPDPSAMATLDVTQGLPPDPASLFPPVAAAQVVGPAGGTVVLTSPDEVVYTLEVPAGAVAQDTMFQLTPMENVGGLPFSGGLQAAVGVEPFLPYDQPLTLTVQLPAGRSAAAPLTVGFGSTDALYLMPFLAEADVTARLHVLRGGVYGLAVASAAELTTQAAHVPPDAAEQMQQLLALLPFTGADPAGVYGQAGEALLDKVQRLPGPGATVSRGRAAGLAHVARQETPYSPAGDLMNALVAANSYWNTRTYDTAADVFHTNDARDAAVIADLAKRIKDFIDDTNDKCVTKDDLLVSSIIQKMKPPQLEIFWILLSRKYRDTYGEPRLDKNCIYEMDIVSAIHAVDTAVNTTTDTKVHTTRPVALGVSWRAGEMVLTGRAELTYDQFAFFTSLCPPSVELTPYPAGAIMIVDLRPEFDDQGHVVDFALHKVQPDPITLSGAFPRINFNVQGNCTVLGASVGGKMTDHWAPEFVVLHSLRYGHFTFSGDQETVIATLEIVDRKEQNLTENTTLTITIRHDP